MTSQQILAELKTMGSEQIKQIFLRHGVQEPLYGVRIEDLKKIQKKIKKDHVLSLELYNSGVADAQYLAGLIADENKIARKDLEQWAKKARGNLVTEYTIPWIAAESPHGWELALIWIDSDSETLQATGWATLSSLVAVRPDDQLDLKKIKALLQRVEKQIGRSGNRVRYVMNGFIIAVGSYVPGLNTEALKTGERMGVVTVHQNGTESKVPFAPDYIRKAMARGTLGKKKKMARC